MTEDHMETMRTNSVDFFGACPACGGNDGYCNVGRDHWFICDRHQTKWCRGSNLFSSWKSDVADDWEANAKLLAGYASVDAIFPNRALPPDIACAVVRLLTYVQETATWPDCSIHEHMKIVGRWLTCSSTFGERKQLIGENKK